MQLRAYLTASVAIFVGVVACADEGSTKASIRKLLEEGWSITPSARAAADAQFEALQSEVPNDERVLTASALVLMQQRRYDDAGKRLNELLVQNPNNLLAIRAKCWLSTTLKNYGGAVVDAEKLRSLLPAETTQDRAAEAEARDHLAFLGRICGYLAGPVADNVDQLTRKQLEKTISAGLSEGRLQVFTQARDGVTQKYFELTDTKVDTEKKNIEDRKTEAEQTLQDVEAAKQQIAERVQELEEHAKKLEKELNDELVEISKLDRPLVAELSRLQIRASNLQSDVAIAQGEIDRITAQLTRNRDPTVAALLRRDAAQARLIGTRAAVDLDSVSRQADSVQAQRALLAQKQQQAQANYGGQLDRANKELASLGKREKRVNVEEKKARRPVSRSSTRTAALSSQVTALSTYEKFPLDQARQRLLNSLR